MREIVVVGSHVYGAYVGCETLPRPGETVMGHGFDPLVLDDGGKGSNQAMCAARLGAATTFLGVVGDDTAGRAGLKALMEAGVDVSRSERSQCKRTGVSVAIVDGVGSSLIVTDPGANLELTSAFVDVRREIIADHRCCLLQFETPAEVAIHAGRTATAAGVRSILTPGPMQSLEPGALAGAVDVLVPNEMEAATLLEVPSLGTEAEAAGAARRIADRWAVQNVVLTRGANGVSAFWSGDEIDVPAFAVEARNTIGAGDGFTAAMALAMARECGIRDALIFACAVAALSVTHPGAPWSSYPNLAAVATFLGEHGHGPVADRVLQGQPR